MSNKITIAIDASTKSTGIAVFEGEKLIEYKCLTQTSKNVLTRIKLMTDEIEKFYLYVSGKDFNQTIDKAVRGEINDTNIQIIMEQIIPDNLDDAKWTKNQQTFKALFYLQAAIVLMFHHYNKEVEFIGASSWRKQCGIKQGGANRDLLKARDIEFVKEKFNIAVNDDIADAICIGYAKVHEIPAPQPFNWE